MDGPAHPTGPRAPLGELLGEDWARHGRKWHRPGFHAVAVYRLGSWAEGLPGAARLPALVVYKLLYFVTRNVYGIELPAKATVGRRLLIGHQSGIVVSEDAVVGDDCLIRQNVTIGALVGGGPSPVLGDRVELGAGAVVAGGITVGDGALIGPNAVVTQDVPPGAVVSAPPARILVPAGPATAARTGDVRPEPTLERILDVIAGSLQLPERPEPDTPLLSSGLVDSFNLVVVVTALEEAFGVELAADELSVENFDTPAQIQERLASLVA